MHDIGIVVQKSTETRIVGMIKNVMGYTPTSFLKIELVQKRSRGVLHHTFYTCFSTRDLY